MALPPFPTRLCAVLGIRHPILLAGMAGGPTTPELVAAVSRAGGLGTLGAHGMRAEAVREAVARAHALAGGAPVAVNVLVAGPTPPEPGGRDPEQALEPLWRELGLEGPPPPPPPGDPPADLLAAALEAGARAVSVGLGDPAAVAPAARAAGVPLIAMASTVADAERCAAAGADVVVAQGAEAGGHRSLIDQPPDAPVPLVGTFALVPQVARAVDVPVVAAGGVMDGRGLAAALCLGADGVQMGTRFLVAAESGAAPAYRRRLRAARDVDTVVTRAVSARPARGLRNRLIELLEAAGPPARGWPAQSAAVRALAGPAARADHAEGMILWAGQAAGLAGPEHPAERIVAEVVGEAAEVLSLLTPG